MLRGRARSYEDSPTSADEAIASLQSGPLGLSAEEAERRLREHGPNVVQEVSRRPAWLRFVGEFVQFFSLILWVAAGLAFVAEWSDPGQGMAKIGFAIVIVILVSGLFSFWQEYRVEKTLAALRKLLPQQVKLMRGGKVMLASAEQLVPGDIVVLEQGDNIPADCRLVEAFDVARQQRCGHGRIGPAGTRCSRFRRRRADPRQEHPAGRHFDRVWPSQGGRLRHRHADRVRQDRAAHPDASAKPALTAAEGTSRGSAG